MSFALAASAVCFVVCHAGPADHFATYGEVLRQKGYSVAFYASGPALQKLKDRRVEPLHPFTVTEGMAADRLAERCSQAAVVITDVGHVFQVSFQKALARQAPKAFRFAYYDNPEPFVPGGYSEVAARVMEAAQGVLFANGNLASDAKHFPFEKRIAIGYYPMEQAKKIAERRASEQGAVRSHFFAQQGLEDRGQKIVVYTGGNNEVYFEKAFPAFLRFLEGLDQSRFLFVLQQHPGAKGSNRDLNLLPEGGMVLLSQMSTDEAQVLADGIAYYQTSMGPQFVLAGIPTIQVGHERYDDILVRNHLCAVANSPDDFRKALANLEKGKRVELDGIEEGLGLRADWKERLVEAIKVSR